MRTIKVDIKFTTLRSSPSDIYLQVVFPRSYGHFQINQANLKYFPADEDKFHSLPF